jgi:hypothetical protein
VLHLCHVATVHFEMCVLMFCNKGNIFLNVMCMAELRLESRGRICATVVSRDSGEQKSGPAVTTRLAIGSLARESAWNSVRRIAFHSLPVDADAAFISKWIVSSGVVVL